MEVKIPLAKVIRQKKNILKNKLFRYTYMNNTVKHS